MARRVGGEVVVVDGKAWRRSHDRPAGKEPREPVSGWATANHLVQGPAAVGVASNQITAIPELVRGVVLEGCIVTIDAVGCRTAIAGQTVEWGADDVRALKGNRPTPHRAVEVLFAEGRGNRFAGLARDDHRTVGENRGRTEGRRVRAGDNPGPIASLDPAGAWPNRRSVALVEGERRSSAAVPRDTRYDLSSLPGGGAAIRAAVRGHGVIENSLHWRLDVGFRKDEGQVRRVHADRNRRLLRRLRLNLLRRETAARLVTEAKRL